MTNTDSYDGRASDRVTLDERFNAIPALKPFIFFLYNALDICKLAAGENDERAQAARNLLFQSGEKWGLALLKNLNMEEDSGET